MNTLQKLQERYDNMQEPEYIDEEEQELIEFNRELDAEYQYENRYR